jgi:hypothetical protein
VIERLTAGKNLTAHEIRAVIRRAKMTGPVRPTSASLVRKKKALKRDRKIQSKPTVRFTKTTGPLIRKRLPPVDGEYFLARIRYKENHLLICEVTVDKNRRGHL